MSYKLTNTSGSPIVCDLAVAGKSLRLNNKQTRTIKDTEMTPHIKNLINKGLILSEVSEETQVIKKTTTKSSNKKKEE